MAQKTISVRELEAQGLTVDERMQELVQAGLIAWNGRKLPALTPAARTRGERTVANLLLDDRETFPTR
jgi:hypothetical protein